MGMRWQPSLQIIPHYESEPIYIDALIKSIKGKLSSNLVLFIDDKFNTKLIKRYITTSEFSFVSDLLKINDLKKNLLVFDLNSKKKIVLVSIKKTLKIMILKI